MSKGKKSKPNPSEWSSEAKPGVGVGSVDDSVSVFTPFESTLAIVTAIITVHYPQESLRDSLRTAWDIMDLIADWQRNGLPDVDAPTSSPTSNPDPPAACTHETWQTKMMAGVVTRTCLRCGLVEKTEA